MGDLRRGGLCICRLGALTWHITVSSNTYLQRLLTSGYHRIRRQVFNICSLPIAEIAGMHTHSILTPASISIPS
ncbi:hypothetical protein F5B21DRAFT_71028 [Xylaria acuta]|nr:hypothetical protein F5B21DRAFT_71028 [Xylaria acuta]